MRKRASLFPMLGMVVALQVPLPIASLASDGSGAQEPARQEGEGRWVPSLAIIAGATIQEQQGVANSYFEDSGEPIRGLVTGDDLAVAPFVGGSLELMTPALPIPGRPRLFLGGEILPTFSSDRDIAVERDPSCFKGPEPTAPCARDETVRQNYFRADSANGVGTTTTAWVDTLVFGASLGVAFPVRVGKRELRIKASARWIQYEVEAEGFIVDGSCYRYPPNFPSPINQYGERCTTVVGGVQGDFRERILEASASQKFNGIGPGLEIEMDTFRFGPIGSSIFLGGGAYRVLGDRDFSFDASATFDPVRRFPEDPLYDPDDSYEENPAAFAFGPETDIGAFGVEVDPWMFRAHVGIRFQWLGFGK